MKGSREQIYRVLKSVMDAQLALSSLRAVDKKVCGVTAEIHTAECLLIAAEGKLEALYLEAAASLSKEREGA